MSVTAPPRSLLLAALLVLALLGLRVGTVESPTMAGDEYAFIAQGRYADAGASLYVADPGLQEVHNAAYPWLYSAWRALAPDHPAQAGRLFNALAFVLGALLLFAICRRLFDAASARLAAILYLGLPLAFYATTLLPEVEFQWSIYLVSAVVAWSGARPRAGMVALAGALCALSYQVKPHAAALIAGCAAYWFATGLLDRDRSPWRRLWRGLALAGLHVAVAGLLIVLASSLGAAAGSAPSVVPSFYKGYLAQAFSGSGALVRLGSLLDYAGGHLWVLLALFSPGFLAIAGSIRALVAPSAASAPAVDVTEERRNHFALYLALVLAAFIGMVALFTSSAAELSPGEQFRLHGRYLAGLIPFLLAYAVWACGRRPSLRTTAFALACLLSFAWLGRRIYKLYPWDYPEAFAFFAPPARYWAFDGQLRWPIFLVVTAAVLAALACLRARSARVPFVVFTLAWMLAAQAQMWRWVDQQADSTRPWTQSADAIEQYLGPVPALSGAVLTEDRYGLTAAFLASLDSMQHVVLVPDGKRVGRADLPAKVSWVVAAPGVDAEFEGAAELDVGKQRLFLLDRASASPSSGGDPLAGKAVVHEVKP